MLCMLVFNNLLFSEQGIDSLDNNFWVQAAGLLFSDSAFGCSAFLLNGGGNSIIGFNENWDDLPGIVVINRRGVSRTGYNWAALEGRKENRDKFSWKAKHGSVSFSCDGVNMPIMGLNEKGLFIVKLYYGRMGREVHQRSQIF